MNWIKSVTRLALVLFAGAQLTARAPAAEAGFSLVQQWSNRDLAHQTQAGDVFQRDGYAYTGGGPPNCKISKIRADTGAVQWSFETGNSYQPSYPVSNGRAVVFGSYSGQSFATKPRYRTAIRGLDDATGKLLWEVQAEQQVMSAACFGKDLAFIGTYDKHLYAIDWKTGELKWKTLLGGAIWSRPCVHGGLVIIGCYDGGLYCLDQATGKIETKIDCGGVIRSDVTGSGDLLFVIADDQEVRDAYDGSKTLRRVLVVDMLQKKIIQTFASEGSFSRKVVVSGKDVFFNGDRQLYCYDTVRKDLAWKLEAPPGLTPCPIVMPTRVLLALNASGRHGEHTSKVAVYDRTSGAALAVQKSGGIGVWFRPGYAQVGDMVVDTDWGAAGYRVAGGE